MLRDLWGVTFLDRNLYGWWHLCPSFAGPRTLSLAGCAQLMLPRWIPCLPRETAWSGKGCVSEHGVWPLCSQICWLLQWGRWLQVPTREPALHKAVAGPRAPQAASIAGTLGTEWHPESWRYQEPKGPKEGITALAWGAPRSGLPEGLQLFSPSLYPQCGEQGACLSPVCAAALLAPPFDRS